MKAIFISFNQAYYEMILSIMDRNNLRGFTYWEELQGRGSVTGDPHYGNHAWPTLNSAILTMVEDEKVDNFLNLLHKIDKQTEAQGLRAFVWNIEKVFNINGNKQGS
jgi:hypothetical protein